MIFFNSILWKRKFGLKDSHTPNYEAVLDLEYRASYPEFVNLPPHHAISI